MLYIRGAHQQYLVQTKPKDLLLRMTVSVIAVWFFCVATDPVPAGGWGGALWGLVLTSAASAWYVCDLHCCTIWLSLCRYVINASGNHTQPQGRSQEYFLLRHYGAGGTLHVARDCKEFFSRHCFIHHEGLSGNFVLSTAFITLLV